MMKLLLKILAAPIVAILAIFVWLCTGILYISGWVFGIAGILMGILCGLRVSDKHCRGRHNLHGAGCSRQSLRHPHDRRLAAGKDTEIAVRDSGSGLQVSICRHKDLFLMPAIYFLKLM